ncbi:hypothetical protein MP228_011747 [Amoeboaphelidium protococcarum]|nr:hypothetical protein MP228_011747 [Amoeboaphelidium protococcarum]
MRVCYSKKAYNGHSKNKEQKSKALLVKKVLGKEVKGPSFKSRSQRDLPKRQRGGKKPRIDVQAAEENEEAPLVFIDLNPSVQLGNLRRYVERFGALVPGNRGCYLRSIHNVVHGVMVLTEARRRIHLFGSNDLNRIGIFCLLDDPSKSTMAQIIGTPLQHFSRSEVASIQQRAGAWVDSVWNIYPQFNGRPLDPPTAADHTRLYNTSLLAQRLGIDVAWQQERPSGGQARDPIDDALPDPDDDEGQTHRRNWGRARKPSDFGVADTTAAHQTSSQGLEGGEQTQQQQQAQLQDQVEDSHSLMEVDQSSSDEDTFQSSDDSSDQSGFEQLLQEQRQMEQVESMADEQHQPSASSLLVVQTPLRPQNQPSTAGHASPVQQTLQSLAVDSDEESERESVKLRREEQRVLRLAQRRVDDQIIFIRHTNSESEMAWGFGSLCRVDVGKFEYAPFFVLATAIQHDVVDVMDCCKNLGFTSSSVATAKSHVLGEFAKYLAPLMFRVQAQGQSMVAADRTDAVTNLYSAGSSYKSMIKGKQRMETGQGTAEKLYELITNQNEQFAGQAQALLAQPGVILNRAILEQVLEYSSLMPIRDHIGNLIFESDDDDDE